MHNDPREEEVEKKTFLSKKNPCKTQETLLNVPMTVQF